VLQNVITKVEHLSLYVSSEGFYQMAVLVGSETTSRVYNTTVKAYQGWAYLALTFEKYGIATSIANLKTKITFTAKSNNLKTT
jgi:hypothetical protein